MSLRTFERLLLASSLTLGAGFAVGCSDDGGGGGGTVDAGRDSGVDGGGSNDSGRPDSGRPDAGSTVPETLTNANGDECAPVPLITAGTYANPCWVDEEETVCGVDANALPGGDPDATEPDCKQQDAPGKLSTYCGAFFDQIDGVQRDADKKIVYDDQGKPAFIAEFQDGAFTVENSDIKLRFEGCCLPTGECGAMLSEATVNPERTAKLPGFNLHLGCTSVSELAARLADPEAESLPVLALPAQPFCNYEEDDPGVATSGTLPGVPVFVCGCGEGELYDPEAGGLPCLNNLNTDLCGAEEATEESLALIPQFVCGAVGATPDPRLPLPTLPNVPSTTCGGKVMVEGSEELNNFPIFVCGSVGDYPYPNPLPTLPKVDVNVCGTLPAVSATLETVPEILCGCVDSNAVELGCLRNVAANVCGGAPVTTGSPALTSIPAFICGCGAGIDDGIGGVCLSNVEDSVCGAEAVVVANENNGNLADDCLAGVPEYAYGCGTSNYDGTCLRNAAAVRGCDNVTTRPRRLPESLCGCGDGAVGAPGMDGGEGANGLPCLPFVDALLCGGVDITPTNAASALPAALYPSGVCGCGQDVRWSSPNAPCLDNVVAEVCGTRSN